MRTEVGIGYHTGVPVGVCSLEDFIELFEGIQKRRESPLEQDSEKELRC